MRGPGPSDRILTRLLSLHPKIIDLTLDRVWRLLHRMGNPERALPPVVHIAGTNGKGSTLAMIRAGLEADGGRVHAYTSPHLVRFHERIRLAGTLIEEGALSRVLEECEAANGGDQITYFEITTVAALVAFARAEADWTLLEVGLGGRLDATNVVDRPRLTVITPVSFDHQKYLGETLAKIAFEKAGILKPGVPCIVAPQTEEALEVIERRAAEVGAPLYVAGQDWLAREERGRLVFEGNDGLWDLPLPRLLGAHQVENAGTAVAALRALDATEAAAEGAMTKVDWPARMQRLTQGALVDLLPAQAELWLDGGHNAAAGEALAEALRALDARAPAPTWAVMGMLETKAAEAFLSDLAPHLRGLACVTIPNATAALPAETLAARARTLGIDAWAEADIRGALASVAAKAGTARSRVLICGSLYFAGAVLAENDAPSGH